MQGLEGFGGHEWNPFSIFGITASYLKIDLPTVINTWIVLSILFVALLLIQLVLYNKSNMIRYLIVSFVDSFISLCNQTMGVFVYNHFLLVTSLFIFIIMCNWISLIPGLEEPTANLNTPLALGIISFGYKEVQTIKVHGFIHYIKEFMHPFFIMFPLNVVTHFSKILSISFRLFGNIFGGSIIYKIYMVSISRNIFAELVGLFSGLNFGIIGFFIIFEGFMQAFVFAMLTLTYLSIAIQAADVGELD